MLFSIFGLMAFRIFSTFVLPVSIIAGVCLAVAVLVISIGEWKTRMGLFPRFKSLASAGDPARAHRMARRPDSRSRSIAPSAAGSASLGSGRFGSVHDDVKYNVYSSEEQQALAPELPC
jgi:hypothetical protein